MIVQNMTEVVENHVMSGWAGWQKEGEEKDNEKDKEKDKQQQ